jgi:O-antigen ligase
MYKGGFEAIRASLTVAGFVSSVTAISVFVLYNSGVQSGYIESMILSPTNPRVMPFFYDPNHYASVLVVAIAFILSGIFDSTAVKSVSGQIIYSASLVLSIVAVLMTGSRSGIGALVVVIGFTTLIKTMVSDFKYSIQKAVAVGFPTLVIALIGLAVTGLMDSLVANVRVRTISAALELRISLWHAAIATWEHYPITGVGPHNFIRYLETLPDELVPRRILFPHNTYLTLLSETGLLGAIVGIGIVIEQLVGGIREIISDATSELIVTVSALLALLAMAMFIDIYASRRLSFVLGVLAALSMQGESRYMSIRNLT